MSYLDMMGQIADIGVDTCDKCGLGVFAGGTVTKDGAVLCSYHSPAEVAE